jgi:hypothetical protein
MRHVHTHALAQDKMTAYKDMYSVDKNSGEMYHVACVSWGGAENLANAIKEKQVQVKENEDGHKFYFWRSYQVSKREGRKDHLL